MYFVMFSPTSNYLPPRIYFFSKKDCQDINVLLDSTYGTDWKIDVMQDQIIIFTETIFSFVTIWEDCFSENYGIAADFHSIWEFNFNNLKRNSYLLGSGISDLVTVDRRNKVFEKVMEGCWKEIGSTVVLCWRWKFPVCFC